MFCADVKAAGRRVHILGLVSPGGVHAHQTHIAALAQRRHGVEVRIHALMDGRDTPPKDGHASLTRFVEALGDAGRVVSVIGRYWAMDRDKRWDRVERAWRCMTLAEADGKSDDPVAAVAAAYERGEADEFITPTVIDGHDGIRDGDGLLVGNFRADRVREVLSAYLEPDFGDFERPRVPSLSAALGMVDARTALPAKWTRCSRHDNLERFGAVAADAGLRQLRIAETEKYPHVTFFLNGGRELLEGEDRIMIPSLKVATYDLQPGVGGRGHRGFVMRSVPSPAI